MGAIKTYFYEALTSQDSKFSGKTLKRAMMEDYMNSGVVVLNNDSTSMLIRKGNLADAISEKVLEGMLGEEAKEKLHGARVQYIDNKKQDAKLTYTFNVQFSEVDGVDKTYDLFKKAIVGLGELNDNIFDAVTDKNEISKKFKSYETLIVENMVRFEDMFDKKYVKFARNRDAVCSLATILLLRGIAQDGEEKAVDELSSQLLPFVSNSIKAADKKYMGDLELLDSAIALAQARVEELNKGLGKKAYIVDFSHLIQDERIFQEMNKVCRNFAEYNVNLYGEGSNGALAYINDNGELELCDLAAEEYDLIESLCRSFDSTQIATEERLLKVAIANIFVIENSSKFSPEQKKQLSMALSLPIVQISNKLGDEVVNQIFKETVDELVRLNDKENASSQEGILSRIGFDKGLLSRETSETNVEDRQTGAEENSNNTAPKKSAITIRKGLVKTFSNLNWKYYEQLKTGKIKKTDEVVHQAKIDSLVISGLMGGYSKTLVSLPAEFIGMETGESLPMVVVTEFTRRFLVEEAEKIAQMEAEEAKQALAKTRGGVRQFFKESVKERKSAPSENEKSNNQ